jgi:exodeoxyribonuclease-3
MSTTADRLRIVSWNVNGLRSCASKGFASVLARSRATLFGVQEVRAAEATLPTPLARPRGWHSAFFPAERPGYSGVGLYSRLLPDALETKLGEARFDAEGRLQIVRLGGLVVANVYFPNGSGKERDNSRVPFKLEFYRALFERLEPLRRDGSPVLVMGDFNTAHREIDLARPRENQKTSGFLPEERAELERWIRAGWSDAFRRFEPGPGHYTWWSQRWGVRERNVGWRIDYVLVSEGALPHLRAAWHRPQVTGSDHCPIGVELDPAVLRARPPTAPRRPRARTA